MMPMYSCFKYVFGILFFLLATQLFTVNTIQAQVPNCGMTAKDTLACRPYALLSDALNANDPTVNFRRWTLSTCGGATVFTTPNGLNPNFSYIINNPGCYCLTLFSRTITGDTCSFTQCNIVVADTPVINMTFAPTVSCTPLTVFGTSQITTATGTINSVVIQPGCGNVISLNNNPTNPVPINFNTAPCPPGQYDITVVAINSAGCGGLKKYDNVVTIVPKPVACFAADTTTSNCATAPLPVTFTACNTANNVNATYSWYINGVLAQSSTASTFSNTFAINPLCYSIKLVVTQVGGCSDSLSLGNYICVRSNPNISFTSSASTACVATGASSSFTLTNTTAGLANLTWSMTGFPTTTGPTATYTVNSIGTYTVTATGSFGSGCNSTLSQQVFTLKQRPNVNFTADDTFSCSTPLVVNYSGQGCATCTYAWTFSGNSTPSSSTLQNPSVTHNNFTNYNVGLTVTDTNGCNSTLTRSQYIKIRRVRPNVLLSTSKGCAPICVNLKNSIDFNSLPGETLASACWSFPGSTIPGACKDTINRCFVNPGCYDVKLVVTTQSGCIDSVTLNDTICARVPPVCSVTASPTTVCYEEDSVVFTIQCDSVTYAYIDFDDGTKNSYYSPNSSSITVAYFYQDIGDFEPIVITYRDSCVGDTFKFNIKVNAPIAEFKDSTACALGDTVMLIDLSKQATSLKWYFCNGDSSTVANPRLYLPNCDTCLVRLVATNSVSGCVHEYEKEVVPICSNASLTPVDTVICRGQSFRFDNKSTSIQSSQWSFLPCNAPNFPSFNVNQNSSYTLILPSSSANPGVYCIAMRNVAQNGCIDTVFANFSVCGVTADFTFDTVCFPSPICFKGIVNDSLCNIAKYEWFYNGNVVGDTVQNPCHVFPSSGTYQVKLKVTNNIGCVDSVVRTVLVSAPVNLNYIVDTLVCSGATSCVVNNSSGLALTYNWASPGSTVPASTSPTPCFSYPISGVYPVYLEVKSNNVCTIRDTFDITSANPIAGGFVSTDTLTCPNPPTVITYTDTSKYNVTWLWDFGDNSSSAVKNPGHIYTDPGSYVVTLTVTNPDGCADTKIIDTIVVLGPYGSFSFNPTPGICACKDSVEFTVNTVSATSLTLVYGCNVGFTTINPISPLGTANAPTSFNIAVPYCISRHMYPSIDIWG
jgi:PKD repeat protein